jgi:hypothetical protein
VKTRRKAKRKKEPRLQQKLADRIRQLEQEKKACEAAEPEPHLCEIHGEFVLMRKSAGYKGARAILYAGKLVQGCNKPLAVAKYLAEEIRLNPSVGWRLLKQECKFPAENEKGYLPKMLKALGKLLEDQQQVFDKKDHQIVELKSQHPHYTNWEITSELSKQYPEQKWPEQKLKTLLRRVERLLKDVPR